MHGFRGRLLHVDLSTASGTYRELDPARLRGVLGGAGLGVAAAGERIHTLEKLSSVVSGYYRARRWDENGFVPDRRLAELGIR